MCRRQTSELERQQYNVKYDFEYNVIIYAALYFLFLIVVDLF